VCRTQQQQPASGNFQVNQRGTEMTDLNDPQQLEQVLEALGANNTQTIRRAEFVLKPFLKTFQSIPALLHQIEHSSNASVAHVAALILNKKSEPKSLSFFVSPFLSIDRINNFYFQCGETEKRTIKTRLLHLVSTDLIKPVRTAVVATLAKILFSSEDNWSEVFGQLIQFLQSPDETLRAVCFTLLGQVRGSSSLAFSRPLTVIIFNSSQNMPPLI
jgi:hypothetical protein